MTMKEFSQKYGVNYKAVFEASYGLEFTTNRNNEKHYDEQELKHNVLAGLNAKRMRAIQHAEKLESMIKAVSG